MRRLIWDCVDRNRISLVCVQTAQADPGRYLMHMPLCWVSCDVAHIQKMWQTTVSPWNNYDENIHKMQQETFLPSMQLVNKLLVFSLSKLQSELAITSQKEQETVSALRDSEDVLAKRRQEIARIGTR